MRLYAVVVPPMDDVDHLLRDIDAGVDTSLTWEMPRSIRVDLCFFGNLVLSDVTRLTGRLSVEVAQTPPFDLRFTGGGALEEEGDDSVWAAVGGDLDALGAMARSVAALARTVGFSVDRRWYRPRARIARINPDTTVSGLQDTVNRLQAYEGAPWRVTEVLLVEAKVATDTGSQVVSTLVSLPLHH